MSATTFMRLEFSSPTLNRSLILTVFLLTILLQGSVQADPFDGLNLSDEKLQQLHQIHQSYKNQRRELENSLKSKKFELIRLLRHPQAQRDQVKKVISEIMEVEHQRQNLYIDELFDSRKHLTEQQWNEYQRSMIRLMLTKK